MSAANMGRFWVAYTPGWHQTSYFRISVGFMAFVFVLLQFRTRQLKRRQIVLEEMDNQITKALELSRYELKTQEKLFQSEKHASLGRLVRGMAHELNTPLGILKMAYSIVKATTEQLFRDHAGKPEGFEAEMKYKKFSRVPGSSIAI